MLTGMQKSGSLPTYKYSRTFWIFCSSLFLGCIFSCTSTASTIFVPTITHTLPVETQEPTPHQKTTVVTKIKTPYSELTSSQSTPNINGYTHQRKDGNRFITGAGQFPEVNPIDITLPGVASWVVAIQWMNGSLWVVTLENGQVFGYQVNSQGWQPVEIKPQTLEAGQPPLLSEKDDNSFLLIAPSSVASPLTHSIPILDEDISQAYIDTQGN